MKDQWKPPEWSDIRLWLTNIKGSLSSGKSTVERVIIEQDWGKVVLKRTMEMKQTCEAQLLALWREQEKQKTPGDIGAIEESWRIKNTVQRKVLSD